ncbi:hypothetical protein [Rhizobium sp. BK176]|uniref:hypothetical protein n=1 Tax=Rhizobium sp. BK176 TaxID=2587071 RepID=UPI002167828F|nr:hypothetical protein [Rhizobium sp. BK176]MCS4089502.1 hypothetical protein [Rhizobium sp. BK176]
MPDKNKDQFDLESDYNFDAISEFESDGKGSKSESSDAPDFGEFETSSEPDFGTFDGGAEFEGSTENVDFGSQEFEPTDDFGGGDVDFDFGGPPSPQSVELESLSGNPDEEFGDFTGNDGFGTTLAADPYDDDAAPARKPSHDPFSDDDDDHTGGTGDNEEEGAEAAPEKGAAKPGIKYYAGVAAAVAVVGFIGYTQVLPMFFPQDNGQVVAEAPAVLQDGPVPSTLPAIPASTQQPQQTAAIPAVPAVDPVAAPVDGTVIAGTPALEIPTKAPAATDTPIAIDAPAAVDNPVVAEGKPSLDLPAVGKPAAEAPAKVDPLDEMVGGTDRGGLASMKGETAGVPVKEATPIANADIAALASRLDEVVKRIDAIEQRVASFGASFDGNTVAKAPVAADKPVTLPAVADGGVTAPLKPPIIENAVLRGVSRDIAWIATGKDVVEVKVGDTVADAGVVESFQNYRGRWIAVTDKGIILPR